MHQESSWQTQSAHQATALSHSPQGRRPHRQVEETPTEVNLKRRDAPVIAGEIKVVAIFNLGRDMIGPSSKLHPWNAQANSHSQPKHPMQWTSRNKWGVRGTGAANKVMHALT